LLASQPRDWREVVAALDAPVPVPYQIQYQKHMTHHMLPDIGREWMAGVKHVYLVRDPAHVLASYAKVRQEPTLADLGYAQQASLFRDHPGPVINAADVLRDPRGTLMRLCAALGIPWNAAMLHWERGPRETDGVWARHWYASVEASTCFATFDPTPPEVPARLQHLVDAAMPFYAEVR
jgi:hypothetical protein